MSQTVEPSMIDNIDVNFKFQALRSYFDEADEPRNVYVVTVSYKDKSAKFTYGDSIANTNDNLKPKKVNVLEIITSDFFYTKEYYPDFGDFVKEMGLNEDSIKDLETYKKCLVQGDKLHQVFTDDDIKKLREELDNA
jgi:hypothetical protein